MGFTYFIWTFCISKWASYISFGSSIYPNGFIISHIPKWYISYISVGPFIYPNGFIYFTLAKPHKKLGFTNITQAFQIPKMSYTYFTQAFYIPNWFHIFHTWVSHSTNWWSHTEPLISHFSNGFHIFGSCCNQCSCAWLFLMRMHQLLNRSCVIVLLLFSHSILKKSGNIFPI